MKIEVEMILVVEQPLANLSPRAYKGGGEGGWMPPPQKVFLEFFRDELSSPPAVFSSCAHIPYTHFDQDR